MPIKLRHELEVAFALLLLAGLVATVWILPPVVISQHNRAALSTASAEPPGKVVAYFSPLGGCTGAVDTALARATKSIHVLAYSFTSQPIADALIAAKARGVQVELVIDANEIDAKNCQAPRCQAADIPVWTDAHHAIAHNKLMLIDGQTIVTGSFNFTFAAEHNNAENLLVLAGFVELNKEYEANFQLHRGHSQPWDARKTTAEDTETRRGDDATPNESVGTPTQLHR